MNGLAVKDVQFNGATLRAAQDAENMIWVGVRWVCQGIGLTEGQARRERKRIHEDLTLKQGESNLTLPTDGGNQSDNKIGDWSDQIIAPLVKKYDDHSNAGMATYRRVYKKMDADNKICWKNLTTRYINEHGKKPLRKNLIETRPSLRKKFKNAVRELMEETQEV